MYDTRVTGQITISPPLAWHEIKDSRVARGLMPPQPRQNGQRRRYGRSELDVIISVLETEVKTQEGWLLRREGVAIVPKYESYYASHDLVNDVMMIVESFPNHTYAGFLECSGEDQTWRVIVRDGRATRVHPQTTWPHVEEENVADKIAFRIRAELVCCNIYGRVNDTRELTIAEAMAGSDWHDLCYWGEAAARLADAGGDVEVARQRSSAPPAVGTGQSQAPATG